jgi:hypothetical protein
MAMPLDESWYHELTACIKYACTRAGQSANLRVVSECDDAIATHCQRFRTRLCRFQGFDYGIQKYQVRHRRSRYRGDRHAEQK